MPPVVVDDMHDSERLESPLVEGNGAAKIRDGYEDMVEQNNSDQPNTVLVDPYVAEFDPVASLL